MKKCINVLLILIVATACRSSKSGESYGMVINPISDEIKKDIQIIKLKKSTGVIFPSGYESNLTGNQSKSNRFTPSIEEVKNAEIEIQKQYLEANRRFVYEQVYTRNKQIYGDQKINKQKEYSDIMKWVVIEAKRLPKFDRQYIGYIENGEKKLFIIFIDFSKDPYNLKKQLTKSVIFGWHGWFSSNVRMEKYNMNTKVLSVH
ncbi:hypothetical protein [Kordia sp.]|uniref:hypothetical protein n=1 Tax=Kordia sp. TaxID=1965332 RepID=UPI003D6A06FC